MDDYWLTIRFSGEGAAARREKLVGRLREDADGSSWWDETDSFILFRSSLTIEELRDSAEGLLAEHDFLLIGMVVQVLRWEVVGRPRKGAL